MKRVLRNPIATAACFAGLLNVIGGLVIILHG